MSGEAGSRPLGRLSIALATYNGARHLGEQLDSYLAQTRQPDELVVGDDGSTDGTLDLLRAFAARAPFPVRVTVNQPNLGPARNFAATIARCSGDVVFLSDQDDIWLPEKLETMVRFLAAHPRCLLATHDAALVDAAGVPLGPTLGRQIERAGGLAGRDLIAGCCMAVDARLAALMQPMPRLREHDSWLAIAAEALDARGHLAAPLIRYRRHGSNVSQSYMSDHRPATAWRRFRERAERALDEPVLVSLDAGAAAREDLVAALQRQCAGLAGVLGQAAVSLAIARVSARLATDQRRAALIRAPLAQRPRRWLEAAKAGDYSGSDGLLSLLRDLRGMLAGGAGPGGAGQ